MSPAWTNLSCPTPTRARRPLTFNMVATHVLGAVLGAVLVWTVRPPPHVWRHMLLATVVGNTGQY